MHLLITSVFNRGHGISYSFTSVFGRIGVDFNGRIFAGCCWPETNAIATRLFMWSFGIFKFQVKMISSLVNYFPKFLTDLVLVCLIFMCFDTCIEQQFIYGDP